MLTFERISATGRDRIAVEIENLIIAGWAGRDAAAIEHHIEELAALGIPRPSTTPVYYRVAAATLTQSEHFVVLGPDSSGEVEPVVVSLADGLWIGIGSDHTDRKAEAVGIALSKQLCGKPVGRQLWRYEEIEAHWDQLVLRSFATIDGQRALYQESAVASLRTPRDLIRKQRRHAAAWHRDVLRHAGRDRRHPARHPLRDGAGGSRARPHAAPCLRHQSAARRVVRGRLPSTGKVAVMGWLGDGGKALRHDQVQPNRSHL